MVIPSIALFAAIDPWVLLWSADAPSLSRATLDSTPLTIENTLTVRRMIVVKVVQV